uniref:RING-type domain-containing protein n=1 Tax=Panagrolaimus superbus TaxID=310955 RepID=A0A914Y5M1_9BILA
MSYSSKSGCSRNGKIHSKLSFKAPKSQKFSTLQKIIFGENKLSKKDKLALKASKNGNLFPNICYSLNKCGRWDALGSLENIVEKLAENDKDMGFSIAAIKCENENWIKSCKRIIKVGKNGGIQSYKVKSKRGAPFISLLNRDSEVSKKKEKGKKESMKEKLEEAPLIMYKINEWQSKDSEESRPQKVGKKAKKVRKITDFDENDFLHYADVESEESEYDDQEEMEEDMLVAATTSKLTIGDCIIVKTPKTRKRKSINFDMIDDEIDKIKMPSNISTKMNTIPDELATMGDEFVATFNRICDIQVKGFFNFPSFISFEEFNEIKFMYDFHWLNTDATNKRCLFTIPKADKNEISNFDSSIKLECIQINPKNRHIRITINSTHDFDVTALMSKTKDLTLTEKIIKIITNIYNTSLKNSVPFNVKPSMTISNPSLTASTYPIGDFELLYQCQNSSLSNNENMEEEFEIISLNEKCNFCYKTKKYDLTLLQCGHHFCNECSTKSIRKQIRNCSNILSCEICETPFDPLFILSSTPLLLLQYYLRIIKSDNNDSIVCPSCQGVLIIEKDKIKFGNIQCKKCGISFCVSCKDSPHFPLTCDQMKIWTSKILHEAWFTKNGQIQCYCDTMLSIPSNLESNTELECSECARKYQVMWNDPDYYNKMNRWWWKINVNVLPYSDEFTPNIITKKIKNICLDAHFKSLDTAASHGSMAKRISKLGILDIVEARILYTTTLHFMEFGYAWLYLNKKSKTDKKSLIQKCLKELRGILSEFENRDFQENDVIGCEKLKQWKSLTNKVLNNLL